MPTPPGLFRFIQQETGESWKEMYRGLNCGVGTDIVGKDNPKVSVNAITIVTTTPIMEIFTGVLVSWSA